MTLESQKVKKHSVVNVLWFVIFLWICCTCKLCITEEAMASKEKELQKKIAELEV